MVEITRRILQFVFTCLLILSCGILLKLLFIDSYILNKKIDQAKQLYYDSGLNLSESEESGKDRFAELLKVNPDICGWISITNTKIDYPVLQSKKEDPEFYLSHDYKKEESKYGSIFIDSGCNFKLNPKNTILYGHHMADGQMFADLIKYSDIDFYRQNPLINYTTIFLKAKWKIISVFKTNTLTEQGKVFQYVVSKFGSDNDFMNYVDEVIKRSIINTGVDVNKNDILITLSTCSYEFDGFRTVVVARKVRDGENDFVDTSLASKSLNPLMPDCWYKKYGGAPPS